MFVFIKQERYEQKLQYGIPYFSLIAWHVLNKGKEGMEKNNGPPFFEPMKKWLGVRTIWSFAIICFFVGRLINQIYCSFKKIKDIKINQALRCACE